VHHNVVSQIMGSDPENDDLLLSDIKETKEEKKKGGL
jgi:hypothetical protein